MKHLIPTRTGRLGALACTAFALLLAPTAAAGDIILEATGVVVTANPSGGGVFSTVVVGDAALLHVEVSVPGMDLVAGQYTNYTIDGAASYVEIGGYREMLTGGQVGIINDFPVADRIQMMNAPAMNGGGVTLEAGDSTGTLFSSTDITTELGSWPSSTWTSYNFGFFGAGNFIEFSLPDVAIFEPMFGTNYCGPAVPNSSGASGTVRATGSPFVANNDLGLLASALPTSSFGFFIVSSTQGFAANPGGSQGNLCVGGAVGRFIGQIQNSGATGEIAVTVDLTQIPQPTGPVVGAAGESWNFQCWFRDANPTITSNFTDAIEVVLE
ncbi:hypothetical protein Poly30_17810 [Planctomycetes bacterium Poly30]|uniref:DUF5666 domain-containing protein n=1 Tax=Saltatorellus ferox TaxID=2528018 RepID=A0A518EQB0_9BACT|nr:hypothetical protein Poly30_17810 [Planctomycetes bacterium Poly30]